MSVFLSFSSLKQNMKINMFYTHFLRISLNHRLIKILQCKSGLELGITVHKYLASKFAGKTELNNNKILCTRISSNSMNRFFFKSKCETCY